MLKSAHSVSAPAVLLLLLLATVAAISGSPQQLPDNAGTQPQQQLQQQFPGSSGNLASQPSSPEALPTSAPTTTSTPTPTTTTTTTTTTTAPTTLAPTPTAPAVPVVPTAPEAPKSDSHALPHGPPVEDSKTIANPEAAPQINPTSAPSPSGPPSPASPQALTTTDTAIPDSNTNATAANATDAISLPNIIEPLIVGIKTIVDLSYPLNNATLHWPTNRGFAYTDDFDGEKRNERNESYYLKSDGFSMAVHTGTHLDAPRHFSKEGWTVDQIPLERLIEVPMTVIDLSDVVRVNRSYQFSRNDFIDLRTNKSLVEPKSVVLVYTGISGDYQDGEKAYFGGDTKSISEMRIPGFSGEAAKYLVEVGVYGVGLDAPSADSSKRHGTDGSYDPVAHSIFNLNNIYILENINNKLSELAKNDVKATLTIAPLPITGGSGSPVRLVAVTFHSDCSMGALNSGASTLLAIKLSSTTIATILASLYVFAVAVRAI